MDNYLVGQVRNTYDYCQTINRMGAEGLPPVIITCAITGGIHGAEANPNLPEKPEDQAQAALDAYNAGASMVHIHARNPETGYSTTSVRYEEFLKVNQLVREKCPDLIINNTSVGARYIFDDKGAGPLQTPSPEARPEVVSLDLVVTRIKAKLKARPAPLTGRDKDVMFDLNLGIRADEALEVLEIFDKFDCKPEYELFSLDGIKILNDVLRTYKGDGRPWVSLLLGGNGTFPSIRTLMEAADLLPAEALFNVIGIGSAQIPMATAGIVLGHHVRVGLEDNVYYSKGVLAESNGQMVERVASIAKAVGRRIATPAEAREMLGLGAPRQY